jgi:hypothetical protein
VVILKLVLSVVSPECFSESCLLSFRHIADSSFAGSDPIRRNVKSSGLAGALSASNILSAPSPDLRTRSQLGVDIAPAAPSDKVSSFAWASRSMGTKFGRHLSDLDRGRRSKFKVSLADLGVGAVVDDDSDSPSGEHDAGLSGVEPSASDDNVAGDVEVRDAESYEAWHDSLYAGPEE